MGCWNLEVDSRWFETRAARRVSRTDVVIAKPDQAADMELTCGHDVRLQSRIHPCDALT